MVGQVGLRFLNLPRAGVDQNDVERLERVADFCECGFDIVDRDAGALGQMAEVEHDGVAIAILKGNALRPRRVVAHMAERVHVGADVIAKDDQAVRGEPVDAVLGGADVVRELFPVFIHHQRGTDYAREADHIVMDSHGEVDQLSRHQNLRDHSFGQRSTTTFLSV